jgi:hypothetical protein
MGRFSFRGRNFAAWDRDAALYGNQKAQGHIEDDMKSSE